MTEHDHPRPSRTEPPEGFARYRTRASILVRSPEEIKALAVRAGQKVAASGGARLENVREDLGTFIDLLKAYASGDYRRVSTRALISIVAAVLYFVVPLDFIPDFILALGFLDDVAVIGYVLGVVREEMREFQEWQRATSEAQ